MSLVKAFAKVFSVGILAAATFVGAASANDLVVRYDQSTIVRLPRAASDIIIGNPSIADVSIQGGTLLVITGKTFGTTNVIALDSEQKVIRDQRVLVTRDDTKMVSLHQGSVGRTTYTCAPRCHVTLTIGDEKSYYERVKEATEKKLKISEGSADGGAPAGQ
ncbi:MAG: pilus assembly protein N-terminal domain-containing protein [Hyphomicrobiaceae bacterium]|nr:pilus assembly protein N-terminal domain-containing protein [Hyphomicrobiaceae bacterium]